MNIELLTQRFIHRDDVYAVQWFNEAKGMGYYRATQGTCPLDPPCPKRTCEHITNKPITRQVLRRHLSEQETIAIYQLTDDNTVKWLCLDIDIEKRPPPGLEREVLEEMVRHHTTALAGKVVEHVGRGRFLVEYSGSKGYHIWVFFDQPVDAINAYAIGHWLSLQVKAPEGIHVEVFPKQTDLRGYGNMVKLPMGVHQKTKNRCEFVNHQFVPYPDQWACLKGVQPLTNKELLDIIKKNNIDVLPSIRVEPMGDQGKSAFPCFDRMMSEGLGEGTRDVGLFKLSCYLKSTGMTPDMTLAAVTSMNTRNSPPLDDFSLQTKVESAYVKDYSRFPCGESALDVYCSSSCRFWTGKLQERWTRYNRDPKEAVGRISRD